MKKISLLILTGALMVAGASLGFSQNYDIAWHKVSGGGAASTNGQFTVTGTIGQPDASGALTNGIYSVTGGFWAFAAVQTPGGPYLNIYQTSSNTVIVAWPAPSTGIVLQQNSDINTTNWVAVTGPTNVVNGQNQVDFVSPNGRRFFRLSNH